MGRKKRQEPHKEKKGGAVNPERRDAEQKRRQKILLTWAFIIVALIMLALLIWNALPKPSPYNAFAKCLAEAGATMYGTDWCSHCQSQKRLFGTAFKYVPYENCDYSRECEKQGVTGYPTWILINGTHLTGEQPLALLAEKTGCKLT